MIKPWVLHADMDAFFASVEQRDHPEYRGKPVIVGATGERGVVAAASYEARKFGVHSAMPGFRARTLCPDGIFVRSNIKQYSKVSRQISQVFEEFTPVVEPLSLDEAFLDISGSSELFGGPLSLARRLKQRVFEQTELPVSVGIAPTKMVAKLACSFSKPRGLLLVPEEWVTDFLRPQSVRNLWGVGPVTAEALLAAGLRTMADIADADPHWLKSCLGERGLELRELALGRDDRKVDASGSVKSIGEENTFPSDASEPEQIYSALSAHADVVARRLRQLKLLAKTVTLKAKLGKARGRRVARGGTPGSEPHYPLVSRSKTLSVPTDDAAEIRELAWSLWKQSGVSEPIRLLGVTGSNLTPAAEFRQLSLFDVPPGRPMPRAGTAPAPSVFASRNLGPALDAIERKFGEGAVRRGGGGAEKMTASSSVKRGQEPVED